MEQNKKQLYLFFVGAVMGITTLVGMEQSRIVEQSRIIARNKYYEHAFLDSKYKADTSAIGIYVKNLSKNSFGNPYDIYVKGIPSLNASNFLHEEIFLPYGTCRVVGVLSRIDDIQTRGSTPLSLWASNKAILDAIKNETTRYIPAESTCVRLFVAASLTGFYVVHYEWFTRSVSRSNSGEFEVVKCNKHAKKEKAEARKSLELLRERDNASGTDL